MVDEASKKPKLGGTAGRASSDRARRRIRVGGGLLVLVVLVVVAWLVLSSGDSNTAKDSAAAHIVTVGELREAAAERTTPVYWAGEQAGTEIELSQPDASRTYVRYLTGDAEAGAPGAGFLTVATYAHDDPVGALRRQSREPGGVLATAPGGATVYFSRNHPTSVYLAYPGVKVQIEVYDPSFKRALQLVESGQIVSAG
jgi:hypothetical protein